MRPSTIQRVISAATPGSSAPLAAAVGDGSRRYARVIEYFADVLHAETPDDARQSRSIEEALIVGIARIIGDHLRAGRLEHLRRAAPELIELTLLPYLGPAEARRWARRARPPA